MNRFDNLHEAYEFVTRVIDQPACSSRQQIGCDIAMSTECVDKGDGTFTNVYDLSFDDTVVKPEVHAFDALTAGHDYLASDIPQRQVVNTGGFFFLVDRASRCPRQLALNLSLADGTVRSLPVTDREAVIAGPDGLTVRTVEALGAVSISGKEIAWSGSLSGRDTPLTVFSNGNIRVIHEPDPETGKGRVLDESSRYTPPLADADQMDVGFIGVGDNQFVPAGHSPAGSLDIFADDFVVRGPRSILHDRPMLRVRTIGGLSLDGFNGGAFNAGPALDCGDFDNHPTNSDPALGSTPPFADESKARAVVYKSGDGLTHLRLFDGRPGSPTFVGVTPDEAVSLIKDEHDIVSGCFLDGGQSARMTIRGEDGLTNYGNLHYLKWPSPDDPGYAWTPCEGRPVANMIVL